MATVIGIIISMALKLKHLVETNLIRVVKLPFYKPLISLKLMTILYALPCAP